MNARMMNRYDESQNHKNHKINEKEKKEKNKRIRSQAEITELNDLTKLLLNLHLTNDMDTWEFIPDALRRFTVINMQKLISSSTTNTNNCHHTRWNKLLPSKVNILTWRVSNKRLPTRSNLDSRRIDLDSTRCRLCDNDIKTEDHVFVYCPIATDTWKVVYTWWELIAVDAVSVQGRGGGGYGGIGRFGGGGWGGGGGGYGGIGRFGGGGWGGGVPNALDEYVQMGAITSRKSLQMFCKTIMELYGEDFLRKLTYTDMEKLYAHHDEKHGFLGMFGNIDCTDLPWANCPVAYRAQFSRGDHRPNPFI
nr:RNA-directed DNA polymerase, eukaryota, reverse transcriptase zinc-binding domain protein [Tanacetum cinerariifolium]